MIRIAIFLVVIFLGCKPKPEKPREFSKEDVEAFIEHLEDRKRMETVVIEDQDYALKILQQNLEKAKSDGMKEKIRKEMELKELVKNRAKAHIANHDSIIVQMKERLKEMEAK